MVGLLSVFLFFSTGGTVFFVLNFGRSFFVGPYFTKYTMH